MKFTDAQIRHLAPKDTRYIEWEDNGKGLGIRVSPKGKKTWIFMYRFEGKARMATLGNYPATSVAKAHAAHGAALVALDEGRDPGAEKVAAKAAHREAETVSTLIDEYIEKHAKLHKRTWKEDKRMLDTDVRPLWGERKAKDITRRDVIRLLDGIAGRGAGVAANRTLAVVRKMFNFAIGRDIVEMNPCFQVKPPAKEQAKDRYLSADEIRTFCRKLPITDTPETGALALFMILVTAQRPGEVLGMRWNEIQDKDEWWEIPAERTKNKLIHRVYLSMPAREVLKHLRDQLPEPKDDKEREAQRTALVFPSPRAGAQYGSSIFSKFIRRNLKFYEIPEFTPHDLRRTASTHMHEMGFTTHIVGKVLNHKERGVTGLHYNRYEYAKEKQQALEAWARRLDGLINGKRDNVVTLVK